MKNLTHIAIIISALSTSNSAYATEIYKCIDENAQISFSFSVCSSVDTVAREKHVGMTFEEQMDQLEIIDKEISRLNRQFRDLKLEEEYSLQSAEGIQAERQIRKDYEKPTHDLLDRLFMEKEKRGQLMEGSIALLSQPHS